METVVQPPDDAEIHLLTEWGDPGDGPRRRKAATLSLALHAIGLTVIFFVSESFWSPAAFQEQISFVTPLIAPLTQLTQKAPNTGKLSKEFDTAASVPRPRMQRLGGAPGAPALPEFRPSPPPTPPPPAPKPIETPPDAPKLTLPAPRAELPSLVQPQIQAVERPASPFETPATQAQYAPGSGLPLPKVTDAIRGTPQGQGGSGLPANQAPSPGIQPNAMQLLSDPMGVDFRPYITQVLASVKRYWLSVWPESARLGATGRVELQFTIDNKGGVPSLKYARQSGSASLDRAAVAAISGSVPFPPFPKDYKAPTITLQLNFSYNLDR